MARITIAELQSKLDLANKIIEGKQEELDEIRRQYKNTITEVEFNNLLNQYNALEQKYKALQSIYNNDNNKKKTKINNERNAGRKSKINDNLIANVHKLKNEGLSIKKIAEELEVSAGLVHKIIHL